MKSFSPQPSPSEPEARTTAEVARRLLTVVTEQATGFSIAYLVLGLGAEVLRRFHIGLGSAVLRHLDGLPFFVLREVGLLEHYLTALAYGRIAPFWNRALLSGISLALIWLMAAWTGVLLLGLWRLTRRNAPG